MLEAESIKLSPGEKALVDSIIEHVYPEPKEGRSLPVERDEMRAARGMARKGLITLNEAGRKAEMNFTKLGAQVYNRCLQAPAS